VQHALIHEIFASVQGEGPWIGQRHIFVRFMGCDIACRYCDTPAAAKTSHDWNRSSRVQKTASSFDFEQRDANISTVDLTRFCLRLVLPGPGRTVLSLTGGEPLLQHAFLAAWLPEVKKICSVYLETNGIHYRAMTELQGLVDVVSMDFKLPSATGLGPLWNEHERFLSETSGADLFVKAVVTGDTARDDIVTAAGLLARHDRKIPFILQPAEGVLKPKPELLIEFQNMALALIEDVRIIPQAHKTLNLP
jgi:organic radical activating enzyme